AHCQDPPRRRLYWLCLTRDGRQRGPENCRAQITRQAPAGVRQYVVPASAGTERPIPRAPRMRGFLQPPKPLPPNGGTLNMKFLAFLLALPLVAPAATLWIEGGAPSSSTVPRPPARCSRRHHLDRRRVSLVFHDASPSVVV